MVEQFPVTEKVGSSTLLMPATKKCSVCFNEFDISFFYKKQGRCKKCSNKQTSKRLFKKRLRIYSIVNKIKGLIGCDICGQSNYITLDFNHVLPYKKTQEVNILMRQSHSVHFNIIFDEIKKCNVLCANCHRLWHHYEKKGLIYEQCKSILRQEDSVQGNCEGGWYCI